MIIPLLATGLVFSCFFRSSVILSCDLKQIKRICSPKELLIQCSVVAGFIILAAIILLCSKLIQEINVKHEIGVLDTNKKETIVFQESKVPSRIQRGKTATNVSLQGVYDKILSEEDASQLYHIAFFKVCFKVVDAEKKDKVYAFAKYEKGSSPTAVFNSLDLVKGAYRYPYLFSIEKGVNTLYIPIFLQRGRSAFPFTGIELSSNGKDIQIVSVERIIETDKIHTQSAFLVPEQLSEMHFTGNIDWKNVFWGKKY